MSFDEALRWAEARLLDCPSDAEPIDAFGAITKVAELAGVAIAVRLLGRERHVVKA